MARIAIGFLIVSVAAYFVGALQVAGASMDAARYVVIVFFIFAAITGLASLVKGRNFRALSK